MSDHYKEELKKVFKLDSAKNIASKLVGGHGDPNMKGGSGALGLIGGVLGGVVKTIGRLGGGFANTAKQYMRGGKAAKPSNFKDFHRDGVTFDTKMINDAFAQRFGKPQNVIKKATEGQGELAALKKAKNMASKAGPKNSFKGLNSSP